MKKFAAEMLATFILIFAGTGAVVINDVTGGTVTHLGISLVFGLVVTALIHATGDVSGCHINPAVTVGLYFSRKFEGRWVLPYISAQLAGAFLASLLLRTLFPEAKTLGETIPRGSACQSFILEIILTLFLLFTVLAFVKGQKGNSALAGVVIGGVIALEAMFAGPISGASMNPARSLAPGFVSGNTRDIWVYVAGPIAGALLGVLCSHFIHDQNQPAPPKPEI